LRVALAEAVTRCALFESDAVEHEAFIRSLKEELRLSVEEKALAEERLRAFETENAGLRAAAEEYEKTVAAKDAAFAAAEARAAEEALSLSRETADAVAAVERATKESAAYRRKLQKAEAEIAAKARDVAEKAASASLAEDELHAECSALRDALKRAKLALKEADEAKKSAVAETETLRRSLVEEPKEPRRAALREVNGVLDDSAKRDSVMRKLVEKLRCDLKQSEESCAKTTEALAVETSARKDAEARLSAERLASSRAKEKENAERAEKTVEPRTCSLLPW
jgi:chromosome segregation ATPase